MQARGIKAKVLATQLGVHSTTIGKLLRGEVASSAILGDIFRALGLPWEEDKPAYTSDELVLLEALRRMREAGPPDKVEEFLGEAEWWAKTMEEAKYSEDQAKHLRDTLRPRIPRQTKVAAPEVKEVEDNPVGVMPMPEEQRVSDGKRTGDSPLLSMRTQTKVTTAKKKT